MSPDADRRIGEWVSSMHFGSFDQAYSWIYNNQHGKVYRSQYEGLQHYFAAKEFQELPFIELQPNELVKRIQQGEPINAPPPQIQEPFPQDLAEQIQEPEPEPSTNAIRRLFNALRGIFS